MGDESLSTLEAEGEGSAKYHGQACQSAVMSRNYGPDVLPLSSGALPRWEPRDTHISQLPGTKSQRTAHRRQQAPDVPICWTADNCLRLGGPFSSFHGRPIL